MVSELGFCLLFVDFFWGGSFLLGFLLEVCWRFEALSVCLAFFKWSLVCLVCLVGWFWFGLFGLECLFVGEFVFVSNV